MTEQIDEKRITLRIPADMYDEIASMAKIRHLSINSYILQLIGDTQYANDLEARIAAIENQIVDLQRTKSGQE